MDQPPEKTVFVPRAAKASGNELFEAGDVVGQYRIERVLGKGGMGVVYLVQHTALKKYFALKALPAGLAQEPSFVSRFKREAEMLARLKHGHIVNVTDFGENQGRLYLVLEYVDGGSLEDWFDRTRRPGSGAPAGEVKRMLEQMLQGLAHAHENGVIHRDLKPANVLLEKSGEAKISDFGLARAVADEEYRRSGGTASPFSPHGDSVTTTGSIVGTIDFMSPEARNMRPSDIRSDIYAIGVIAYYLLTGSKPHGMAQPASKIVPGLDPRWDKFISTCLAEKPEARYQTAAAALLALQQIRQESRSIRWMVAAAVVAVAAVGGFLLLWRGHAEPAAVATAEPALTPAAPPQPVAAPAPVETAPPRAPEPAVPAQRTLALVELPDGALVTIRDRTYTVGSTGRLVLELPPGPQPARVSAPGYVEWRGDVGAVEGRGEERVPLERVPPHAVRFTGLPPQAQVTIGEATVAADASGAAVADLRPGRYTLSASAPKFETLTLALEVQQSTETVTLELKRLPPPAEVAVALGDGAAMKFRWIPPGTSYVGSPPDERGRQRSDLTWAKATIEKGFYIAETEATQQQHRLLVGRNPSSSRVFGDETRPVEQVAWRDITGPGGVLDKMNEALRKLRLPYRADLPSEAEWEYACRGGSETAFNDGSSLTNDRDDPALDALAFYGSSRRAQAEAPSPVGKFKPNKWGLYDMLGNVAEWTYGARGAGDPVLRGGNWKSAAALCRSASRVELTASVRPTDVMGYRLVLHPLEE